MDDETFVEIEYDATTADLDVATHTPRDEESDPPDLTWSFDGEDAGDFEITKDAFTGVGTLSFKNRPNFEMPADDADADAPDNVYEIIVKISDGTNTRDYPATVTVTNVDETPEITAESNSPSFAEIEYDATSPVLTVDTYTARGEEEETITWSLGGDDASDFTITKDTNTGAGVLAFSNRPNYEMPAGAPAMVGDDPDNTYEIIVMATDENVSPNTTENTREYPVAVTVSEVNEKPDISEDTVPDYMEVDYYFTGTPSDVHTFTATDYDDMDTFEWSLSGNDAGDLEIGSSSGVLTFRQDGGLMAGPLPSFENPQDQDGQNTYSITVVATDNHGKAGEYAVTINVSDEEEAGAVAVDNGKPAVNDELTFTLSDPDGVNPVNDADIDWTIQVRDDPMGQWISLTEPDATSLMKIYEVDEDDTRQGDPRYGHLYRPQGFWQRGGERAHRRGGGRACRCAPPGSVAAAARRSRKGKLAETPNRRPRPPTGMAGVLIFGIRQGPHSDLFELIPSAEPNDV